MDPHMAVEHLVIMADAPHDTHQMKKKVVIYGPDGRPIDWDALGVDTDDQTGAEIRLTGFDTGVDVTEVAATDTVNQAIAKLQNRIRVLEDV